MNKLNKLIEQYWKSKGYPSEILDDFDDGIKDIFENKSGRWRNDIIGLLEFMASRPTCGKEQRKFLDEFEKLDALEINLVCLGDFESDIEKVIKGE